MMVKVAQVEISSNLARSTTKVRKGKPRIRVQ